jgi:hypothetical protein
MTPLIVEDLVLFALQAGPRTSSEVARLLGIENRLALKHLRAQMDAGYVIEVQYAGERAFELRTNTQEIVLND